MLSVFMLLLLIIEISMSAIGGGRRRDTHDHPKFISRKEGKKLNEIDSKVYGVNPEF